MTIKGSCYTNLDEYQRENWPTKFVSVPRIGDRIMAESGLRLKVVCVTHYVATVRGAETTGFDEGGGCAFSTQKHPRIKIELHR